MFINIDFFKVFYVDRPAPPTNTFNQLWEMYFKYHLPKDVPYKVGFNRNLRTHSELFSRFIVTYSKYLVNDYTLHIPGFYDILSPELQDKLNSFYISMLELHGRDMAKEYKY